MFGERKRKVGTAFWFLAAGFAVGLGTAIVLGVRGRQQRRREGRPDLWPLEDGVIDALRQDDLLRARGIDVAAIAPGIIELTGSVQNQDEAHRAVDVAQGVDGVRTVVNRLDLAESEQHRARVRRVSQKQGAEGGRWYGMGVGMGRRRQSPVTDPAQRDDHADLLEEALLPDPEEAIAEATEAVEPTRRGRASELS
jgi:hypothetical protein